MALRISIWTALQDALLIGSKLDESSSWQSCRLAFNGRIERTLDSSNADALSALKVFKVKSKSGSIERILPDGRTAICKGFFKKESDFTVFTGMKVRFNLFCFSSVFLCLPKRLRLWAGFYQNQIWGWDAGKGQSSGLTLQDMTSSRGQRPMRIYYRRQPQVHYRFAIFNVHDQFSLWTSFFVFLLWIAGRVARIALAPLYLAGGGTEKQISFTWYVQESFSHES